MPGRASSSVTARLRHGEESIDENSGSRTIQPPTSIVHEEARHKARALRFSRRAASRLPSIFLITYPRPANLHSFALQHLPLQRPIRLANNQLTASSNHAVPRNAASARRSRHGIADNPRPALNPGEARDLAVCRHPPARNSFHHAINDVPSHGFKSSISPRLPSKLAGRTLIHAVSSSARIAIARRISS